MRQGKYNLQSTMEHLSNLTKDVVDAFTMAPSPQHNFNHTNLLTINVASVAVEKWLSTSSDFYHYSFAALCNTYNMPYIQYVIPIVCNTFLQLFEVFCNDFELFLTSLGLYGVFCAASSATTIALISLCRSAHCSDLSKSYSMCAASGARILPFCNCGSTN